MGKTASGAVWLNADMLSAYDYWQFWRNTEDADVARFLKLFTLLDMDEIAKLEALEGADVNEAKKVLATEATALLHGREAAELAAETARKTFEQGALAESLPTVEISASSLDAGLGVLTAFGPEYAKLLPSTGEARRQVKSGGPEGQRSGRHGRARRVAHREPHAGGRHQALVRQEASRPASRSLI